MDIATMEDRLEFSSYPSNSAFSFPKCEGSCLLSIHYCHDPGAFLMDEVIGK
jgi:hypothetical protein